MPDSDTDLAFASGAEQGRRFRSGELSPIDLTRSYLRRIERLDPDLNAFITVCAERALRSAERAEADFAAGCDRSPLQGIPFAVKDQMLVAGVPLTGGSRVLVDTVGDSNATVVARLDDAGAVLLGTLNTHEFHAGPTRDFPYGVPRNPWDLERSPGGSSSGSAAAVAAGLCTFSLGGDTAGSIRGPASACGVVGLKPTWSRVSRDGVIPLAWSLDCIGPLARTVEDAALVLEVVAGADALDPTCSSTPVEAYGAGLGGRVDGIRVGVVDEMMDPTTVSADVVAATLSAVEVLRTLGARIGRAQIPLLSISGRVSAALVYGEAASHHRKWLKERYLDYDTNTRVGMLAGALLPAGLYTQAERMRTHIARQVMALFETFDVILGPTAEPAPTIASLPKRVTEASLRASRAKAPLVQLYNLVGIPGLSLPCGFDRDGLPLGLQLATKHFDEASLLRVANAYETSTAWHRERPRWAC